MARKKFIYNPQTLDYEEYKPSKSKRASGIIFYIITAAFLGYVVMAIINNAVGTPKERLQAREIEFMKLQYDIMNDKIETIDELLAEIQDRDDNIYRTIFEAEPIPTSVRKAGYGGTNRYEALNGYENSSLIKETSKKIDVIESQLNVQSKSFDDVYDMAKNKAKMLQDDFRS